MNLTSLLTTKPWAPLLAAWYLALALLTELGEAVDRRDGIGTLLYATITAIAAWFLSGWLTRDGARRSLCATLMVLWVGLFGTFRLTISARWAPFPMGEAGILLVWSLGFAVVVALVARSKSPMDNVLKALTVALALLIVIPAAGLLRRLGSPAPDASPVPGVWSMTRDPGTPDVYLILLDKYSHPHWLRQHYGLDVEPFLDSLRTLGFVIPARPRTNYIHTQLAVAALLNSRMVHEELAGLPGEPWDSATVLIEHASVFSTFRTKGYRLAFFPTGFPATKHGPLADLTLEPPDPLQSTFGRSWVLNTPMDFLRRGWCRMRSCDTPTVFPYPIESAETIRWKIAAIGALPDSAGPIFTFVHFLGSHEPYQFDAECRDREPWWPSTDLGADSGRILTAYPAQITCVNRLLLGLITELIERSDIPPVILLQSDHGHGRIAVDPVRGITLPMSELSADRVAERVEVFAAYRFPGAAESVPEGITPVNVMPLVLHALFGSRLALVPDQSYWSTYQAALTLTEVLPRQADTSARSGTAATAP
jgi:hypothetical protein